MSRALQRHICSLALVLAVCAPTQGQSTPPPAQPGALTVDEAVRIGLRSNPQITSAEAGVASAAANYRSLAAPNTVDLGVTRVQGTSTAPSLTGQNADTILDVGHTLDTSGQRRFQAAGAKAQLSSTRYQLGETRITLEQQIRDAYWSLAAARAQAAIAQELLQEARRVNALIRQQQTAGAAPQVDVVRSNIDVANAEQSAVTASGAETAALIALNTLLARPPAQPVELVVRLSETSQLSLPDLPAMNELAGRAVARRPAVLSARSQVAVADYAVKQARAARLPDVSVDYERSIQQTPAADSLVFVARFPLLDLGSVSNSVKSAAATKRQAEEQVKQAEQQVRQQVAQAHSDYTQARKLAASYLADIVNPSLRLREMAELGYKQGATGILPVIDAENTVRNARMGYVSALLALYKANDEILAAVGGP